MKDVAIRDFLDLPRGAQEGIFSEMGYTLKMIKESMDGSMIYYNDRNGKMRKWPILRNKKAIDIALQSNVMTA